MDDSTHTGPAASHSVTDGMWDHKASAATAVNIYRNPNAQTHSQTLVASRRVFAPQTFDFSRVRTHAHLRVIMQALKKKTKKNREKQNIDSGKVVVGATARGPESGESVYTPLR